MLTSKTLIHLLALLCTLLSPYLVKAQGKAIDVRTLRRTEDYNFPKVVGPDTRVSEKINIGLQTRFLSQVPGAYIGYDPYHIVKNDGHCGQTVFHDYAYTFPNPSVLEIMLDVEQSYCTGMGLDWFAVWDYFDLHSGERIELPDLFSQAGYREFKQLVNNEMRSTLKQYIHAIDSASRATDIDEDELDYLKDQIEFYSECLHYTDTTYFDSYKFQITETGLSVTRNHCYGNAMERALDEMSAPQANFTPEYLALMLSAYGKQILLDQKCTLENPSLANKIFEGLIADKYPITAIVKRVGEQTEIIYWYDKVKQPLLWEGQPKGEAYRLTETICHPESNNKNDPIANVTLTFSKVGRKWVATGNWTDIKSKKVLLIKLNEK